MATTKPAAAPDSGAPAQAGLVLGTLIIVAAVANLPLAMANVALPSIGAYFDASQVQLNLVAVGYSLGLACSVLWLGALGDHYGRKLIALLGVIIAIPAALVFFMFPKHDEERKMLMEYQQKDMAAMAEMLAKQKAATVPAAATAAARTVKK